jgi:ATP-dependent exoDNAse (exonuclease V) beta subunit
MHQYIDNLNVAYVAFTRAKNELICLAPAPKKEVENLDKIHSLSTLLLACFNVETPTTDKEIISLTSLYDSDNKVFVLGEPCTPTYTDIENDDINEKIIHYPTLSSSDRIRIRHRSLDYLLEHQHLTDSKLNYGIIMHDILRQITHKSDQEKAIQEMVREGRITNDEARIVTAEMEEFWKLPETEKWFADNVQVLNETTILTPGGSYYRPDRVVINNNDATVVDYKFGAVESKTHIQQVKQYMNLIAGMGYRTKGYVCYVSLRKVEIVL